MDPFPGQVAGKPPLDFKGDPKMAGRYAVAVIDASGTSFLVFRTEDFGATWAGPTTVTEDATRTTSASHNWMGSSPKGVVGLMWRSALPGDRSGFFSRIKLKAFKFRKQ
jgi:hypothetical protein